ncbi:tRNA-binding protein [Flavobacteriaceae bacterium M23B6Z8]
MNRLSWDDFSKVDMRVGTIVSVSDFPEARKPAYKLEVDFGSDIGILRSSAQITSIYKANELLGKQVVAVVNFPEKQIANFMSQCLVLGAVDQNDVFLLQPERTVENGLKIG